MSKSIIETKNLTKRYGKHLGIEDVNLDVKEGEIFGFIGPNGAGKSTTIKCIMDLINKTSGEIFIDGKKVKRENSKLKEEIGYLPSEIHLYDDLTVKNMLKYSASFYKKDCSKRIAELVKKLEIDVDKKIDELSLGNLKKVGIVIALMHEPKLVIMDEATSGLDPLMQEVFYEILLEEKKKGTTIFFSSHILNEVKRICDRVAIIKEGKIVKVENINDLTKNNFVKVKIGAKNLDDIIREVGVDIIDREESLACFIYKEDINTLINKLSKYEVSKLLIEEPSIEEVFMHYYK